MAEEVDDVVGPKGRHDADRVAVRHGTEDGQVTLGGTARSAGGARDAAPSGAG